MILSTLSHVYITEGSIMFQVIGQVAFYDYKAISFRDQPVSGKNYLIKVTCCYSNTD